MSSPWTSRNRQLRTSSDAQDKTQALVDGSVTYGKQFVAAVRNGNVDVSVSVVEDLLPERCRRGSFELDYCAGYAVAA